jgi:hypothetical protein
MTTKPCADDVRVACPLFHAEYGGANPTSALQLRIVKINPQSAMRMNRLWHSRVPEIANWRMCQAYGAVHQNIFYAVALWSNASNQNMHAEGCYELRRFAIAPDAPKNTASRMLSVMVRLIRKDRPEVKRLISYQDTAVHTGTIYKASGWTCAGKTHAGGACGWTNNVRLRAEANGKEPLLSIKHRWELTV